MRHTKVDKPADQGEVLSYSEPEVYMRRANDVKERALIPEEVSQTTILWIGGVKLAVRSQQRS